MIMSLDLSTKSSGVAIFNQEKLVDYYCITASSTDLIKRIYKIINEIKKFCEEYTIETIVVEEVRPEGSQYGVGNQKTHKALMYLQAALIFMLHDYFPKIKVEYLYPSEWRSICGLKTGRGIKREELKKKDIEFAANKYNIQVNDDIADAIGIGYAWLKRTPELPQIDWA